MATVRLDVQTETTLRRLAARRGQSRSEVIRDAIAKLAGEETPLPSALDRLRPFVGIFDSGVKQLSTCRIFPLPDWQKRILQERLADLDRHPDDEQPWDEVKEELCFRPTRSSSDLSFSSVTSKSRSLPAAPSPSAREPKTRTLLAP